MIDKFAKDYWIIRSSGLFDEAYYLKQYDDVRVAGIDPIEHYVLYGWKEGRNPAPWFDTRFYLENNPDVAQAGVNPFVHWIMWGRMEGRMPSSIQTNEEFFTGKKMNKTVIVILGSDRSGTSALAGILHILGICMGKSLLPPAEDNPKGFYENKDITYFNDQKLLSTIKSTWDDIVPIHSRVINDLLKRNDLIAEAINIIRHHYSKEIIFGFKDPRIANLFPFWERVLKTLEIEIKIIIPYRDPLEVALSLQKRNNFSIEKGLLHWSKRSLYAEYYSRNYKRVFISYDDLLERTEEVIKTIADALDIEYPNKYEDVKDRIRDFLDINLKHHSKKILGIADYKFSFVKEAKELFEKLISRSIKDENYVREKFDLLRNEFNSYAKMIDKFAKDYWIIRSSGLFDEAYYLKQYDDVRRAGIDPIEHYVLYGWKEGRNPAPWFDTRFYLENNPDVAQAGVNPFVHWIMWGRMEGRMPKTENQDISCFEDSKK